MRVMEAIEAVYSDDGVVVLMDLGSALMSAEMAVEFLLNNKRMYFVCRTAGRRCCLSRGHSYVRCCTTASDG